PLLGGGARVCGSRYLLPAAQSPQNGSYRAKIPSVPLSMDAIHCRMCSATVDEISRLARGTEDNRGDADRDLQCCRQSRQCAHGGVRWPCVLLSVQVRSRGACKGAKSVGVAWPGVNRQR